MNHTSFVFQAGERGIYTYRYIYIYIYMISYCHIYILYIIYHIYIYIEDCQFTRRYFGNRGYFLFTPLSDMLKFGGQFRQTLFFVFFFFLFLQVSVWASQVEPELFPFFFAFLKMFSFCCSEWLSKSTQDTHKKRTEYTR